MASRRHLIVFTLMVSAALVGQLVLGCASHKKPLLETPEEKAVRIAKDYIREHSKFVDTDRYVASPYQDGWMVRISREIAKNVDGSSVYDPSDTRFVKINADWRVVEYLPSAGTGARPDDIK